MTATGWVDWVRAAPERYDRAASQRPRRELRLPPPEVHPVVTDDGQELRLTRYRAAGAPVMLSHCTGVSSRMFRSDSQPTTLAEYLHGRGFDVWLLDHRLSIELRASRMQSTMDDVARRDYPAAVEAVRRLVGDAEVHVVAHGMGASTLTMALLAGLQGVRSAVCSQVSTHLETPLVNRLKVEARTSSVARWLGLGTLTTYTDAYSPWGARLLDRAARLYPIAGDERCLNPVCHRITAIFGELYEHDRVGNLTHGALHELFGVVNVTMLRQLEGIMRRGHLVDARGQEAYLPHLDRLTIPITFLHGADNRCVLPRSTETTFGLLSRRHGPARYTRHLIEGYGHVDCIIGERADRDVFPLIVDHLERAS